MLSLQSPSIKVKNADVTFTYLDSGLPPDSEEPYTTIIAVHGLAYTAHVFSRIMKLAPENNLRIVAVNRRGYAGSTSIPTNDIKALAGASVELKEDFFQTRGLEFAGFVEAFVGANGTPPATYDGKAGGIAFLPWSSGHSIVISALASFNLLPPSTRRLFASHIRALIMQDPPSPVLGLPIAPKSWFFELDTSIVEAKQRQHMGTSWITSYFDHGDLSARDLDSLNYVVPSILRTPSIYNMTVQEQKAIIDESVHELELMSHYEQQSRAAYQRVCVDVETRKAMPHMRLLALCGDKSPSFSIAAHWQMQSDNDAYENAGNIVFKMIADANHFARLRTDCKKISCVHITPVDALGCTAAFRLGLS